MLHDNTGSLYLIASLQQPYDLLFKFRNLKIRNLKFEIRKGKVTCHKFTEIISHYDGILA